MFFIERDVGIWKCFNSKGYVTPKTLKKIMFSYTNIIFAMSKMLKEDKQNIDDEKIILSFCEFMESLKNKMHPEVIKKINLNIKNEKDLKDLNIILKELDDYEGLFHADDFLLKIPKSVKNKLIQLNPEIEKEDKDMMLDEIIPKEENIFELKKKTRERRKTKKPTKKTIKPSFENFKALSPNNNCNDFVKYFRGMVRSKNANAIFNNFESDRSGALEIMDILTDNEKSNIILTDI
jgi:hypothetical protein